MIGPAVEGALLAGSYLLGAVPFGLLLTRAVTGADVRGVGSGNIGATNVARAAGKKLGAVVLLLDAAKAYLPVVLAMHLAPYAFWLHAGCGGAAFLGHVFPIYLRLHGGKGVASALGALLALCPVAAAGGLFTAALVVLPTRTVSLGSLLGAVVAVGLAWALEYPEAYVLCAALMALLVFARHKGNIGRLLKRQERKL